MCYFNIIHCATKFLCVQILFYLGAHVLLGGKKVGLEPWILWWAQNQRRNPVTYILGLSNVTFIYLFIIKTLCFSAETFVVFGCSKDTPIHLFSNTITVDDGNATSQNNDSQKRQENISTLFPKIITRTDLC